MAVKNFRLPSGRKHFLNRSFLLKGEDFLPQKWSLPNTNCCRKHETRWTVPIIYYCFPMVQRTQDDAFWRTGVKSSCLMFKHMELLNDSINHFTKKPRLRNGWIQQENLLHLPNIHEVKQQMSLCHNHTCHGASNSVSCSLSGPKCQICRHN